MSEGPAGTRCQTQRGAVLQQGASSEMVLAEGALNNTGGRAEGWGPGKGVGSRGPGALLRL